MTGRCSTAESDGNDNGESNPQNSSPTFDYTVSSANLLLALVQRVLKGPCLEFRARVFRSPVDSCLARSKKSGKGNDNKTLTI